MQSFSTRTASKIWAAMAVAGVAAVAGSSTTHFETQAAPVAAAPAAGRVASGPVAAAAAAFHATAASLRSAAPVGAATAIANVAPEEALRARMHWVTVRHGDQKVKVLDEASRLLLVQAAAERAGLKSVGLGYQDVYGVINAETSWIPRTGMGKTGTPSYGLAQFEPGTAKGLGITNPNDPVQAVYGAALNMKHAAMWAADKLDHAKLSPQQYAQKLREGVSVYYNLSTRGRAKWTGFNTAQLPIETQRHIHNVQIGAMEAVQLAQEIAG
jgi:hypothetical protein